VTAKPPRVELRQLRVGINHQRSLSHCDFAKGKTGEKRKENALDDEGSVTVNVVD
jgi:hypothetical protein